MAFDMGWDAHTAGFVTDPAYAVPMVSEAYPHTYTNANGDSINAGWAGPFSGVTNTTASNDPRISGYNYASNGGSAETFTVDLASGSAPGAGTYTVDFACGDDLAPRTCDAEIRDNGTLRISLNNGGAGFNTASGHYIDASGADIAATTTWTGATAQATFASTTAQLLLGVDNCGGFSTLAHFRLTLEEVVSAGGDVFLARRLSAHPYLRFRHHISQGGMI